MAITAPTFCPLSHRVCVFNGELGAPCYSPCPPQKLADTEGVKWRLLLTHHCPLCWGRRKKSRSWLPRSSWNLGEAGTSQEMRLEMGAGSSCSGPHVCRWATPAPSDLMLWGRSAGGLRFPRWCQPCWGRAGSRRGRRLHGALATCLPRGLSWTGARLSGVDVREMWKGQA